MHPINFPGAIEFRKPDGMTDYQCTSAWAKYGVDVLKRIFQAAGVAPLPPGIFTGIDSDNFPYFMTAWQPNKEDIDAINRGEPIYIKMVGMGLPPMALFTLNENGEANFE